MVISKQRPSNVRRSFSLIGHSFREGAHSTANRIRREARQRFRRTRHVPRWIRILIKIYHEYGLKHILLISVLVIYQFIGAGIFYFCEASFDESKEMKWNDDIKQNRSRFIELIIPTMFNNSEFLFFLTANQTSQVEQRLNSELAKYEQQLGIKYTDQKISWDFWNAMLYAQTICTTIGYGHLYPSTAAGRIFTMLYAVVGIPLVLSILNDLGKLLTKCLKTPWYWIKCCCRRMFQYCTKQSIAEIKKLDEEDKKDLEIFDLPIPIAIFVVIAWIFICSATFCIWEQDWDYFVAFYFFFISLSTIGLGDITPTQPKYLLMLFIYIIIGLSLVSMCINLIQAKLESTYEAGRNQLENICLLSREQFELLRIKAQKRGSSSLGVIKSGGSFASFSREAIQATLLAKKRISKCSQTLLSFPNSSKRIHLSQSNSNLKLRFLPRTLSVDDVMKLIDTEEGDILVLTDLPRDDSAVSNGSNTSELISSRFVVSKSFDATNFMPTHLRPFPSSAPISNTMEFFGTTQFENSIRVPSLNEIEEIEEIEDRILLGNAADCNNEMNSNPHPIHFRSRLSLIPEQHSVIEEVEEQENCDEDDKDSLKITLNAQKNPHQQE